MSVVTSIILTCGILEDNTEEDVFPAIDFINEYLGANNRGFLGCLNGKEGGGKCWQINVFGGAFNSLFWDEFSEVLAKAPWFEIENVTLLVSLEDDERAYICRPPNFRINREV